MICFVILHYIVTDETIVCVNSILKNVEGDKKVVVVDNASPNNSYEILCNTYRHNSVIDVIQTGENIGFARGNNFGYRYAVQKYSPEFVLVMNNDMEIQQHDFLEGIEECFNKYSFYVMGPDIYSTKKEYHQNPQTRQLPSKKKLQRNYVKLLVKNTFPFMIALKWFMNDLIGKSNNDNNRYRDRTYIDEVVENRMLHGSCYVFSSLFINAHPESCFFDKTFMYLEAEILYYQCLQRHEKMVYYPYLKVFHHEDVATDVQFKTQYKKSIFSVKCLLQSTKAFIELMNN